MKATYHGADGSREIELIAAYDPKTRMIEIVPMAVIPEVDGPTCHFVLDGCIIIDPADAPQLINALMAARAESKRAGQPTAPVAVAPEAAGSPAQGNVIGVKQQTEFSTSHAEFQEMIRSTATTKSLPETDWE